MPTDDPRPGGDRPEPARLPRRPLGPPPAPEVDPPAHDPVPERTIGDDPGPPEPDPRLRVDFF